MELRGGVGGCTAPLRLPPGRRTVEKASEAKTRRKLNQRHTRDPPRDRKSETKRVTSRYLLQPAFRESYSGNRQQCSQLGKTADCKGAAAIPNIPEAREFHALCNGTMKQTSTRLIIAGETLKENTCANLDIIDPQTSSHTVACLWTMWITQDPVLDLRYRSWSWTYTQTCVRGYRWVYQGVVGLL